MFIFDRERASWGGAEREGDTESEAGFRHWAVITEPDVELKPMDHEIMTWAKVGHLTDWATQMPVFFFFNLFFFPTLSKNVLPKRQEKDTRKPHTKNPQMFCLHARVFFRCRRKWSQGQDAQSRMRRTKNHIVGGGALPPSTHSACCLQSSAWLLFPSSHVLASQNSHNNLHWKMELR